MHTDTVTGHLLFTEAARESFLNTIPVEEIPTVLSQCEIHIYKASTGSFFFHCGSLCKHCPGKHRQSGYK